MYNLLEEKWIPTDRGPVGLISFLTKSREIGRISCDPLQAVAIYRLCLVILIDSVGSPKDGKQWRKNLEEGIDAGVVREYLLKRSSLFDLSGDAPFFQFLPKVAPAKKELRSPWVLEFAQDNGSLLWSKHPLDADEPMDPDFAARCLLAYNCFSGSCGRSKGKEKVYTSRGPLGNSVSCMFVGETVSETLSLNLYPQERDDRDRPCWDGTGIDWGDPSERRIPRGPCEAYLWPSRKIGMYWDDKHRLTRVNLVQGLSLDQEYCDQMSFRDVKVFNKKGGKNSEKKEELYLRDYALQDNWRLIPEAFDSKYGFGAARAMRPWLEEVCPGKMMLSCCGMVQGDYSKIHAWGGREADFGTELLTEKSYLTFCAAMKYANEVARKLMDLPVQEKPKKKEKKGEDKKGGSKEDKKKEEIIGSRLVESYWHGLGLAGYRLANGFSLDWRKEVQTVADTVFRQYECMRPLSINAIMARAQWRDANG